MRSSYRWGWQISSDGFNVLTGANLTMEEVDKRAYVHAFLSPSVNKAQCGWYGLNYCVADINGENRREFVLMYTDANDTPNGARWIDVTGNSKGAIAEAVWSLVFA